MVSQLPALRRYALGLSSNAAAADDLVQDCIERAIRRLDTLQSGDPPRRASRARRTALSEPGARMGLHRNLFIDERRKLRNRSGREETDQLDDVADIAAGPDLKQETDEILRATARLALPHRQVLLLVAVEGLSYRQAAEELGVPIGTVMSRLARARDQLREILSGGATEVPVQAGPGTAR